MKAYYIILPDRTCHIHCTITREKTSRRAASCSESLHYLHYDGLSAKIEGFVVLELIIQLQQTLVGLQAGYLMFSLVTPDIQILVVICVTIIWIFAI